MRIIVTILLVISSIFAQEVKIDSVAIQAKMVELQADYKVVLEKRLELDDTMKGFDYSYQVLASMLIPKEVIVEDE